MVESEANTQELDKQKNSNISMMLIVVNLILLLIFANIEDGNSDSQESINYVYLAFGSTFLLGCYAFSYHGKNYRLGKWLFAIALIISLALGGLLLYSSALAGAFKN